MTSAANSFFFAGGGGGGFFAAAAATIAGSAGLLAARSLDFNPNVDICAVTAACLCPNEPGACACDAEAGAGDAVVDAEACAARPMSRPGTAMPAAPRRCDAPCGSLWPTGGGEAVGERAGRIGEYTGGGSAACSPGLLFWRGGKRGTGTGLAGGTCAGAAVGGEVRASAYAEAGGFNGDNGGGDRAVTLPDRPAAVRPSVTPGIYAGASSRSICRMGGGAKPSVLRPVVLTLYGTGGPLRDSSSSRCWMVVSGSAAPRLLAATAGLGLGFIAGTGAAAAATGSGCSVGVGRVFSICACGLVSMVGGDEKPCTGEGASCCPLFGGGAKEDGSWRLLSGAELCASAAVV